MRRRQLTPGERSTIAYMRARGFSAAEIARCLGRAKSTITREVVRNRSPDGFYRASAAQKMTNRRRRVSRRNSHFSRIDWDFVEFFLSLDWSPEQVSSWLGLLRWVSISHERIYQHIWADKAAGGRLWTHLRQSPKLRRKRRNLYDSRGRLAGKRHISERPAIVETRARIGDCEIDTVVGKGKHCVLTLVDRASGYVQIGKIRNRTKDEVVARATKMILACPFPVLTITSDNGTEFHDYKRIEAATGVTFYFATPYHSWERGTSENTNGLIRQYLRKGRTMNDVTQHQCNKIALKLNTRPRKRLGFRTPMECTNAA